MSDGLIIITPTSIASTGTGNSSSIGANGKVTFSSCATLSLNGVFTSTYDNYMVVGHWKSSTTVSYNVPLRLRTAGTDATGANYTWQWIQANGTTVNGVRTASATETRVGLYSSNTLSNGSSFVVFGPYLSQPTAFRSVNSAAYLGGYLIDYASTHSLSTSYDGFTLLNETGERWGGTITVYGFKQ